MEVCGLPADCAAESLLVKALAIPTLLIAPALVRVCTTPIVPEIEAVILTLTDAE